MCDNVPEALDRASVWCILPKRNMRTPSIIIGGEFRKDPAQVLFVEHDQMIGTLAPDRPDQAFNMPLGQKIKAEKNGDTVLIRGSPVGRGDYDL